MRFKNKQIILTLICLYSVNNKVTSGKIKKAKKISKTKGISKGVKVAGAIGTGVIFIGGGKIIYTITFKKTDNNSPSSYLKNNKEEIKTDPIQEVPIVENNTTQSPSSSTYGGGLESYSISEENPYKTPFNEKLSSKKKHESINLDKEQIESPNIENNNEKENDKKIANFLSKMSDTDEFTQLQNFIKEKQIEKVTENLIKIIDNTLIINYLNNKESSQGLRVFIIKQLLENIYLDVTNKQIVFFRKINYINFLLENKDLEIYLNGIKGTLNEVENIFNQIESIFKRFTNILPNTSDTGDFNNEINSLFKFKDMPVFKKNKHEIEEEKNKYNTSETYVSDNQSHNENSENSSFQDKEKTKKEILNILTKNKNKFVGEYIKNYNILIENLDIHNYENFLNILILIENRNISHLIFKIVEYLNGYGIPKVGFIEDNVRKESKKYSESINHLIATLSICIKNFTKYSVFVQISIIDFLIDTKTSILNDFNEYSKLINKNILMKEIEKFIKKEKY